MKSESCPQLDPSEELGRAHLKHPDKKYIVWGGGEPALQHPVSEELGGTNLQDPVSNYIKWGWGGPDLPHTGSNHSPWGECEHIGSVARSRHGACDPPSSSSSSYDSYDRSSDSVMDERSKDERLRTWSFLHISGSSDSSNTHNRDKDSSSSNQSHPKQQMPIPGERNPKEHTAEPILHESSTTDQPLGHLASEIRSLQQHIFDLEKLRIEQACTLSSSSTSQFMGPRLDSVHMDGAHLQLRDNTTFMTKGEITEGAVSLIVDVDEYIGTSSASAWVDNGSASNGAQWSLQSGLKHGDGSDPKFLQQHWEASSPEIMPKPSLDDTGYHMKNDVKVKAKPMPHMNQGQQSAIAERVDCKSEICLSPSSRKTKSRVSL